MKAREQLPAKLQGGTLKMKIMRVSISIILCMAMLLSLCACGEQKGEYTLSEYLKTGTTIWFSLRDLNGKNSDVYEIYVFEKDGTMYYMEYADCTLGELAQMEDADIVTMVQEGHREFIASSEWEYSQFLHATKEEYLWKIKNALFGHLCYISPYYTMLDKETFLEIRTHELQALAPFVQTAAEKEWEIIKNVHQAAIELRVLEKELETDNGSIEFYEHVINNILFYEDQTYVEEITTYLEGALDESQFAVIKEKIDETEASFASINTMVENIYNAIVNHIEEVKENAKPGKYELTLFSDATGNNTDSEKITFNLESPVGTATRSIRLRDQINPVGSSNSITVYDSIYTGFQGSEMSYITRVKEGVELTLDAVGESDLPVDPPKENPHSHEYEVQITASTCTSNGYSTYVCSCGDSYKANESSAFGHSWGQWENTKEPTYETEGEETRVCSNCNIAETRLTEKLPPYVPPQERLQNAQVGEYVAYGRYEQDNDSSNGAEDLEWLVLAKEDQRILLVSRYCLEMQPYHTVDTEITWENCYLRQWMNTTFLNCAFNEEEMQYLLTTEIKNSGNLEWGSSGGNNTSDTIFALSLEEVERYFVNSGISTLAVRTLYAKQGNANLSSECNWWLRTAGAFNTYAMHINDNGNIISLGLNVGIDTVAARPAVWISLE